MCLNFPQNWVSKRQILHLWTKIFRQVKDLFDNISDDQNFGRTIGFSLLCPPLCHDVIVGLCVWCLKGEFTSKSDVWSFAVTLWEILTLARRRPFDRLSDDEVLANCRRQHAAATAVQGSPSAASMTLDQPNNCPPEIYDLMLECWRADARRRPTFHEMHMFLQRKNSGYSPDDEPLHSHHQQTVSDV